MNCFASSRSSVRRSWLLVVHTPIGLIQRLEEAPTGIKDSSRTGVPSTHGEPQPCARSRHQGHIQGARDPGDTEALALNGVLLIHHSSLPSVARPR